MPTLPSMPRAEDVIIVLRAKVAILLGAIIVLAALGFITFEIVKPPTHWQHVSIYFGILVFGGALVMPDTSLRFMKSAKDLLVAILPFTKKQPATDETPAPPSA